MHKPCLMLILIYAEISVQLHSDDNLHYSSQIVRNWNAVANYWFTDIIYDDYRLPSHN